MYAVGTRVRNVSTLKGNYLPFSLPAGTVGNIVAVEDRKGYVVIFKRGLANTWWPLVVEVYVKEHQIVKLTHKYYARSKKVQHAWFPKGKHRKPKLLTVQKKVLEWLISAELLWFVLKTPSRALDHVG